MKIHTKKTIMSGVGQLSLVEHALCPLDSRHSLRHNQIFKSGYFYSDRKRRRRRANVKVIAPLGLSARDEFFLWGLLALTLANPNSGGYFCATRHYILKQLGVLRGGKRGGRQYSDFSSTLERLSSIRYLNDGFYDPIRAEHRNVSFGFFSYSVPQNETSSRAWRIAWDPLFFEWVNSVGGMLRFNLKIFQSLDVASRRLFLFVSKMFSSRRTTTPTLELRHLGVEILGYSPKLSNGDLKIRVMKTIKRLQAEQVVDSSRKPRFTKNRSGDYVIVLSRAPEFLKNRRFSSVVESPFFEPLCELGFEPHAAKRLTSRYPARLLAEWIDITLAAKERFGVAYFHKCPAAYLQDNLKHAAKGCRTPPDWWHETRKMEEAMNRKRAANQRAGKSNSGASGQRLGLPQKALEAFETTQETIFKHFISVGQSESAARKNSNQFHTALNRHKKQ